RKGYACNITYCTNKQLAFDYLRDRILLGNDHGRIRLQLERLHDRNGRTGQLFLNGLCFAIIDEADSVLIDEACTPLIISRPTDNAEEEQTYLQAMDLAKRLQEGDDFTLDRLERQVVITDTGRELLEEAQETIGGIWNSIRRGEELVSQALAALHLYLRDHHYLVLGGKVMIIDDNTGRIMADRSWERGLHQMIEIKEECEITNQQEHMARMTYQRFFRRYLNLAGMTGTAREIQRELWTVYNLPVVQIPTNRPSLRTPLGIRIFGDKETKWAEVLRQIQSTHLSGRPILVGTRSVADSELLSRLLTEENISHQVLNARQDSEEADIVARAGKKGSITVATNMAGRGTDIPLAEGVAEIGGLHIISTEMNEAGRIDRQLYGRCGRQGDPGSFETLLSVEDELLQTHLSDNKRTRLAHRVSRDNGMSQRLGLRATRRAQAARERRYLRLRHDLLQMEERLGKLLAFSGRLE
ncbi:MAG: helicase-related protein, partial [Desulforhopalus sp.]